MKKYLNNHWRILLLELIVFLVFIIFYGKFGDIMIDSFREAYIPKQVLAGNSIYKDIFVIYPPLSYLINTLLMKFFGTSLTVLYTAGLFATFGIIYLTYRISELFLDTKFAFWICFFIIAGLILSPNVFNSIFPYSYGILYGIFTGLLTIYFVLNKKYPLAYLFCSLSILCKYEFLLLLPILIIWTRKELWFKNIIYFATPIAITTGILFKQGVRLNDIISTLNIIKLMGETRTLHWFYSIMGLEFRLEHLALYLINIIKFLIPLSLILAFPKIYEYTKSYTAYIASACVISLIAITLLAFSYQDVLIFAFPLILICLLIRYKELKIEERFFIFATLLISLKVFFALTLQSYGVYFLPLALISLFIVTPQKYRNKLLIAIILWSFLIGIQNGTSLAKKDMTKLDKVANYITQHTREDDTVAVYPECLAINVLSNRKSDNKFYSLIPLYVETFGEELIKKRFEIIKPEYIITNNYDTSAYFFKKFGEDYATSIMEWINNNYIEENTINDFWEFKIFKRKDI